MSGTLLACADWTSASVAERVRLLARPRGGNLEAFHDDVRAIAERVRSGGDGALMALARQHTGAVLDSVAVGADELDAAGARLADADRAAIDAAIANVERFHAPQLRAPVHIETAPGVFCERVQRPLDAVGLYVPGGTAPLPSTAIMLAVPARIAGCRLRILCTPPRADGSCDPSVLYVARACGIERVFKAGGAQAIAAMAFGTESVPRVDKIFGPGNAWVMAAKQLLCGGPAGPAADLPAGPSEVLVIADDTASAEFIAADLLAQAEHGPDSQVLLVSPSRELIRAVEAAIERQLPGLARREALQSSLRQSRALRVPDLAAATEVANAYAPEHLILAVANPRALLPAIRSAGSVFLGHFTPEALGDYCSGANHVLPTHGYARTASGLSVADFTREMTVQEASRAGLEGLGPVAERLARLEGLDAHAASVAVRIASRAAEVA
ncbi:MAG: histidinol dehydrogenase [Gammaproteobacteria bacterium]|nr:histidinol dehydrogenase [Gammaproteobacteria bacterium]